MSGVKLHEMTANLSRQVVNIAQDIYEVRTLIQDVHSTNLTYYTAT